MSDLNADPYRLQRADERRQAKLADSKAKLRAASGKGPSRAKALREPVTSIAKVESDRSRKNSRTKGNRGELDVAEAFSKWCGELVRRTPGSGGWGGAKDFGTTADLICSNKAFPFHVEVKHREGWTLDDLVTGARKNHDKSIVQWWFQCLDSCPRNNMGPCADHVDLAKEPMLVFRRNRQPWLVMVLGDAGPLAIRLDVEGVKYGRMQVSVMRLDLFLEKLDVPRGLRNYRR